MVGDVRSAMRAKRNDRKRERMEGGKETTPENVTTDGTRRRWLYRHDARGVRNDELKHGGL